MSKCYNFVSHVEYNHVVEIADILTVRPRCLQSSTPAQGRPAGQPRRPRSAAMRRDEQAAGQRTSAGGGRAPQ
jgi:hypothetical protein